MTSIKRIVAIVVTYNRLSLLQECIEALKNQTVDNLDILIIDNASTDGTDLCMQGYEDILYCNTGANLGGAGGFNYGIREAYRRGYDLFWLMDDDTIPAPTSLEELLKVAKEKNYEFGYLVSKALWIDGNLCKMNIPEIVTEQNEFSEECTKCLEIQRATFVSFLVTSKMVSLVGLPIKEFFIWADDTNYCYRINHFAKGYCVSSSVVTHKMKNNQNANIVKDSGERLDRYIYAYRNRFYNCRMQKNLSRYYSLLFRTIIIIIRRAENRKIQRIYYMLIGMIEGWFFNPVVEYVDSEKL